MTTPIDPVFEEVVRSCMARVPLGSFPSRVEWTGIGWIVSVQSVRFRTTRNFEDKLVGGAFFWIDGEILGLTGARSIDAQIVELADSRGIGALLVPWVRERAAMFSASVSAP